MVAAVSLVHHVRRDQQRRPVGRQPVERLPELAPQPGVEADRWLVEHEQLWRPEQGDGERCSRPLAAGEIADEGRGAVAEANGRDDRDDALTSSDQGSEVPQVLEHSQVRVDGRCLGHVRNALPQLRCSGRQAEHGDAATCHSLHADDRAQERRLAATAWTEEARDDTRRHVDRQAPGGPCARLVRRTDRARRRPARRRSSASCSQAGRATGSAARPSRAAQPVISAAAASCSSSRGTSSPCTTRTGHAAWCRT